jgi:hypothetical protein
LVIFSAHDPRPTDPLEEGLLADDPHISGRKIHPRRSDYPRANGNAARACACDSIVAVEVQALWWRHTKCFPAASRSKTGRGLVTAPIFLMVPEAKPPKWLDHARDAERAQDAMPGLIVANWVDSKANDVCGSVLVAQS